MPVTIKTPDKLGSVEPFDSRIRREHLDLKRKPIEILQVNVGKLCNQVCHHCHVEAGPQRTEIMEAKTARRIIELLEKSPRIHTVDITGGAPELCPEFRTIVSEAARMGKQSIDRCNLTVLFEEDQEDLAEFLRDHRVKVVASLPCYTQENVDQQRGRGVFGKSIRALLLLNELGYGREGSGLELDLVYNPLGAYLPPDEAQLEADFKIHLKEDFGILFNRLYTITNMPIKRFLWDLERSKKLEEYMTLLVNSFNRAAAENVMCRNLVSIGWDGRIYDCDFNQMIEIPIGWEPTTIWDINSLETYHEGRIAFADHCYGCAAGAGSSCSGITTSSKP